MAEFTEQDLKDVMDGILSRSQDGLSTMRQEDLESFWFFRYDASASLEWNTYQFVDMLKLYGRRCRQWEEMHNGSMCVVERVRDRYLMPKIRKFNETIGATDPGHVRLPTSREEAEKMVLIGERYLRDRGYMTTES